MRNFISAKRHVTCETVNKSFWQNRAENWGVGSLFFCLLKGQRHLKTKHIQQVMEYAVTCFFIPISGTAAGKYRKPWEARKRALSQQTLIWTGWWKTVFPGDCSGTDVLRCMEKYVPQSEQSGKLSIIAKRKRMQYNKTVRKNGIRRA